MASTLETSTPLIERRLDFGAIWCGVIVSLALFLLFNLVGNAIGLSLVRNLRVDNMPTGPVLWSLGIPLVCLLFGAFVGVSVSRVYSPALGALHGLVIWGLSLVLIACAALLALMAGPATGPRLGADVFWLLFFSCCLGLAGACFGGFLGCRPEAHRVVTTERRVTA